MCPLRTETKARARALQLLYAWELQGAPPLAEVADPLLSLGRGRVSGGDRAEHLAASVVDKHEAIDAEIESAVEGWRMERLGVVERNILRLALAELWEGSVPARVVIDEAVRLSRWFGGVRAHAFVNGVLDTLARRLGRL